MRDIRVRNSRRMNRAIDLARRFRSFVTLAMILLSALLPACEKEMGYPSTGRTIEDENILRFDLNEPLKSICPSSHRFDSSTSIMSNLLYSFLVIRDDDGRLEPDLATEWSYDSEAFTWIIAIRKNALWHSGDHVTADDVKYSLSRPLLDYHYTFGLIKEITVQSDNLIRITLYRNDPNFLEKIRYYEIVPEPKRQTMDCYDHPIGSGPFKFGYRDKEEEICLIADENYYKGKPSIDKIIFYYQPDKNKSWERLLARNTDIVRELPPQRYESIDKYKDLFYFNLQVIGQYTILLYNNADPLFDDHNVRMALTHAIDRESIVERFFDGYAMVADEPNGNHTGLSGSATHTLPYNPQEASRLLEMSGWLRDSKSGYRFKNGECFEFTIYVFKGYQVEKMVAEYIGLLFRDIGIKTHIQEVPYDELVSRYAFNNAFQAVLTDFSVGIPSYPEFQQQIWCPVWDGRSAAGCFEDREVTALFEEAVQEHEESKRKAVLDKISERIAYLQPGTFLYQKKALDVMSRRINISSPFHLNHQGLLNLRQASISPHH